jgi:hypothetical protein
MCHLDWDRLLILLIDICHHPVFYNLTSFLKNALILNHSILRVLIAFINLITIHRIVHSLLRIILVLIAIIDTFHLKCFWLNKL